MNNQEALLRALAHLRFCVEQQSIDAAKAQEQFDEQVKAYCNNAPDKAFLTQVLAQYEQIITLAQSHKDALGKDVLAQRQSKKQVAQYKKHR